jgi:hypothetical protein
MSQPLLQGKFAPLTGFSPGSSLQLYPDAVVWKRLMGSRRIPLSEVDRVDWSATQGSSGNFKLHLRSGEIIEGNLIGAALWKFKLQELAAQRGDGYARMAGLPEPPEPSKG